MNYIIEILDNEKYIINNKGKHPALFVYNKNVLFNHLEEILLDFINEKDRIHILVSNKSDSKLLENCFISQEINIYTYQEFIDMSFEFMDEEMIVINGAYLFDKIAMEQLLCSIKDNDSISIRVKDKNNIIGISYVKAFRYLNQVNKQEFLFSNNYSSCEFYCKNIFCNIEFNSLNEKSIIYRLYETVDYPLNRNLIELFCEAVKRNPDKIAIRYKELNFTYREVDEITDKIAHSLQVNTTGNSKNIGILLGHDWKYVMSIIGILKADMTYVPMSKLYPIERLELINQIADLDNVIIDKYDQFYIDKFEKKLVTFDFLCNCNKKINKYEHNNTIAYIMFTSGSTGIPKGVCITHKNIINNAYFLNSKVFLEKKVEPQNYGVLAEFVFDMSVQQIYPALLFGKTLHIYPDDEEKTPANMLKFLKNVDCCDATPIALRLITDYIKKYNKDEKKSYIHLVVGGEKLSYNLCDEYFKICPENEITNIYGPTECTVEVSTFYLNKHILETLNKEIPIGYPIDNTRIYILDDQNKMLLPNEVGEICVGGTSVGNGYIKSKSTSFCKDILSEETMYKTGDLGFYDSKGVLYYVGRNDNQVKVNGYRVDLGDIEKNLESLDYISEARVLYRKCGGKDKRLIAYIISSIYNISLDKILHDIKGKIPQYMIPVYFIQVTEFKTNINGKLDVEKLPDISNALKIHYDRQLICDNDDNVSKNILKYLEKEFECELIGKNDCDLQSIGCDSLGYFNFVSFIENTYKIYVDNKSKLYMLTISEIIKKIKFSIIEQSGVDIEKYVYKKKYKALPMQNYLKNQEDLSVIANGSCNNMNIMIYLYRLFDDVNEKLFYEAVEKAVSRHDAFNMSFKSIGSGCRVTHTENSRYILKCIDYNGDIKEIYKLIPEIRYFDDILAYFFIVNYKGKKYFLSGVHHLIYDYMSSIFLMKAIEDSYNNIVPTISSYFRIIEEKNRYRSSENYYNDINFWKQYAKNIIPVDIEVPIERNYEKEFLSFNIKASDLDKCSMRYGVSKYILCLGIFYSAIFNATGQRSATIGTFLNGRENIYPTNAIGFLSKYIPFTFVSQSVLFENMLLDLSKSWDEIRKFENCADIDIILDNMEQSCNVLFDYQVMYSSETNNIFKCMYSFEQVQEGFALTFKMYEYKDELLVEVCYSKNNVNIVESIKDTFKEKLMQVIDKY